MGYRKTIAYLQGRQVIQYFSILLLMFTFVACTNTRKATYFTEQKNGSFAAPVVPKLVIQPNDLLSISVSSLNAEASAVFNQANNSGVNISTATSTTTSTNATGFLVDGDGNIQYPFLGQIKVSGLTKDELKDKLTKALVEKKLLVDPILAVRFLNFKVTVLGEVAHPTVVTVPSERISLLEAIGLAGDLTIYAQRDNVLVIRDEGNQKVTQRLNLNSTELFTSPYFYLKSNDVVYVEPNKSKVASTGRTQVWLPVLFSALSLGIIVADRIIK